MREIHHRHSRQCRSRCARCAAAVSRSFDVSLDVILRDAALDAGSFDLAQVCAQLARKFAHRWTGVRLGKGLFVDRDRRAARGAPLWRSFRLWPRSARRRQPAPAAWSAGGAAAATLIYVASAGAAAAAAFADSAGAPAAADSSSRINGPFGDLIACLDLTWAILPAAGAGTSIAAFSVSMVTKGVSLSICWPSFTSTSMTSTSLKAADVRDQNFDWSSHVRLDRHGIGFFRIDAESLHGHSSPFACRFYPHRPAP